MTFTVTVTNIGTARATNVVVTDKTAEGEFDFVPQSVKPPCELTRGRQLTCEYATLDPGEQKVITVDGIMKIMSILVLNIATARSTETPQRVMKYVGFEVEPNLMSLFMVMMARQPPVEGSNDAINIGFPPQTSETRSVLAKLNAAETLDVYVDSVLVADDFSALTAARILVTLNRTAPVVDLVDSADPDNSNPLASFDVDLVTEENGDLIFSQSNMFIVAETADDSLILQVKQNARTEASDPSKVELLIANAAADAGELDFRVGGGGIDQTLAQIGFGVFSDYTGGAPGSYDIEVLQSSDGVSLGTFRFALDAFQGQIVTLLAAPADSGSSGSIVAAAQQAAVTLVAFDSTGALIPGTNVTSVANADPLLHQNYPIPSIRPRTSLMKCQPRRMSN